MEKTCFGDTRFRELCDIPADQPSDLEMIATWLDRIHPDEKNHPQRRTDASTVRRLPNPGGFRMSLHFSLSVSSNSALPRLCLFSSLRSCHGLSQQP
jgi:hypothetical protein